MSEYKVELKRVGKIDLSVIPGTPQYKEQREKQVTEVIAQQLEKALNRAIDNGVETKIASAQKKARTEYYARIKKQIQYDHKYVIMLDKEDVIVFPLDKVSSGYFKDKLNYHVGEFFYQDGEFFLRCSEKTKDRIEAFDTYQDRKEAVIDYMKMLKKIARRELPLEKLLT